MDRTEARQTLHALFEADWNYSMEQSPEWASTLGDRRWNDRWSDYRLETMEAQRAHTQHILDQLRAIPRELLSEEDQLNYDLFEKDCENSLKEYQFQTYFLAFNHKSGPHTKSSITSSLRFETMQDYEDWAARLSAFGTMTDQVIEFMREAIRQRVMQPQIVMSRVVAQMDLQLAIPAESQPFFQPFLRMPESIPGADQERIRQSALMAVSQSVLPALERFRAFLKQEYLPACFEEVGVWQVPEGEALYAFLTRKNTTTQYTPQEIHEIGLSEVARIRGEMEAIIGQLGFQGTFQEFFQFLRTDPQFYYDSPDALLEAYRAMSKRIDYQLPKLFKTMPRMPYGVEPIPDSIAPDTTTAYYMPPAADGSRAGAYYVNLYKPETRPKYEMMALSLHEAVPGHHFQIALAMELGEQPPFRRYASYSSCMAYMEGWALYSEALGEEMGLYDDLYSRFGRLTYEMWRAIRLVVDTGMHAFQWTREHAIQYFLENAAKTEHDVVNEIDRYIAWPAQALSYKIGEIKIKALRASAEQAMGERFDLRSFHDLILLKGAVPLDLLEREVESWIQG